MRLQPAFDLHDIHLPLGNGQAKDDQFFLRVLKLNAVLPEDHQHGSDADTFVAVHKTMILRQPAADGRSF